MPTPTVSNRLLLSVLFLASGAALVGAGIFGGTSAQASESAPASESLREEPAATENWTRDVAAAPAPAREIKERPVRVLVLGDSHTSSTFGRALDLLFRSRPKTDVTTVGACGHRPGGFLSAKESRCGLLELHNDKTRYRKEGAPPSLDALLTKIEPDLTVVELGANQIHTAWRNPAAAKEEIRALSEKLAAKGACVWVGPPTGREREKPRKKIDHVYTLLRETLPQGCRLLDSRPESLDFLVWNDLSAKAKRRGDGKHFDTLGPIGQQAARKWALHVFNSVRDELSDIASANLQMAQQQASRGGRNWRLAFAD